MRSPVLPLLLLCTLVVLVVAWTKEDHEIFRLRDEVEASEGPGVSFYDFLEVKPSASQDEIIKAFRKKSKALHPDKAKHSFIAARSTAAPKKPGEKRKPGVHVSKGPSEREIQKFVKQASERYSQLGVVANVLKGESRERYDHFLRNGFPSWRGTGYYYTRYRPGLGTVLVGLFLFGGGAAHYGVLVLNWKQQRQFAEKTIRKARKAAWGDEGGLGGIIGLAGAGQTLEGPAPAEEEDTMAGMNRRQKRQMEKDSKKAKSSKPGKTRRIAGQETPVTATPPPEQSDGPQGQRKRVVAENGKVLVVDAYGTVFLEEEGEDGKTSLFLLDIDEVPRPSIRDTAVFRAPTWLYHKAMDPFLKRRTSVSSELVPGVKEMEPEVDDTDGAQQDASQDSSSGFEMVDSTGTDPNAGNRKRNKKSKK